MYSMNARLYVVNTQRTYLLQRLVLSRVLNCLNFRFATSNVLKRKKKPSKDTSFPPEHGIIKRDSTISKNLGKKDSSLSSLFTPVTIVPNLKSDNVGEELTGALEKSNLLKVLNSFNRNSEVKILAAENGIDESLYQKGLNSFRSYCLLSETIPADLHVIFSDIINEAGNVTDIFPYFLRHVKEMYPHLDCIDDLKKVGDYREPANWFPEARTLQRKFYFHCGPTNSGKTYHAIQSFLKAKTGIYCAPLKLLAVEVYNLANSKETPCDLMTGEDMIFVNPNGECSNHVSCTVEMCSVEKSFDVAVIDEIQMLRDPQRGWAWTRALLGLKAKEIHICGEEAAIDIVDSILCTTGEKLEVKRYERLTTLHIDEPLQSFNNVMPGDCIVCFNKNDILSIAKSLEALKFNVAIIYGSLPPQTKLSQCENFNNPNHPCNVLVATDAIGMGLNLNIKRIVFYSLLRISIGNSGEAEKKIISVSQALQIAGRAGRFGTDHKEGFVTTFRKKDLKTLQFLLSQKPEKIVQAGLHPTADQIELFSYYLPKSSLSELIGTNDDDFEFQDIFCNLCTLDDSLYFMCDLHDMKLLAVLLDHIPLPLKVKYVFCLAPINKKKHFVSVMLTGFAKMYSLNQVIDANWVSRKINWPLEKPKNWREVAVLESYHEVLDLYLWLSNRFEDCFPHANIIREMQKEIDSLIQYGVLSIKKLSSFDDYESEDKVKSEKHERSLDV